MLLTAQWALASEAAASLTQMAARQAKGEAEWRGLLSRRQIPAVIDPKQGWLANWNNLPSAGWTAGDGTARKRMDA